MVEANAAAEGWHLVEPDDRVTDLTSVCTDPRAGGVALALLEFLRERVCQRLGTDAVAVIRFEYAGAYAALAIRASETRITANDVQAEIERVMQEAPLSAFVGFLREHPRDWDRELQELLGSRPGGNG